MAEELMTAGKWAKQLGVPEKKFKDAIKVSKVDPDAKKGCCSYYSKKTAEKIAKKIK